MNPTGVFSANIFFAYQLSYIPRGYRKVRTRWYSAIEKVSIRSVSKTIMKPAFRIERQGATARLCTEIYRLDDELWWPVVFRPPFWNKQFLFNALEAGVPAALQALSLDVPWEGEVIEEFDPLFVGRVVGSTEQRMQTMAAGAAKNLIVVDGEHLFVRGGEPIWITSRDLQGAPSHLFGEISNSGVAFGAALPLNPISSADETGLTISDINAAAIAGRTDGIGRPTARHPIYDIRILDDCPPKFDPIDFQIRACLRELSRRVERPLNRLKLSQEVLRSTAIFTDVNQYIDHTTTECAATLRVFLNWYRYLPLGQGYEFRAAYDLVLTCIGAIEARCRREGIKSPFEPWRLEPADEEALVLLGQ
ncbi:hypothetical protein [Bradyrhizobium sp. CCH5-F6]|jgi:hypothetical protein|uniref:hypothetical protein n=1 Tax=Bradyrhizobium sp. CCH5-F6 TaxID=1768753 RepID=UPI000769AE05|nr:hypothetical protein [Bradyrhizobium sp. CCH5-F6]